MDNERFEGMMKSVRLRQSLPGPAVRRHLRTQIGLSQSDIADLLGLNRSSVSRYERGRQPAPRIAGRYAVVLNRLAREALSPTLQETGQDDAAAGGTGGVRHDNRG
jgi:transcriptional regulator with XRE-family HTH domain